MLIADSSESLRLCDSATQTGSSAALIFNTSSMTARAPRGESAWCDRRARSVGCVDFHEKPSGPRRAAAAASGRANCGVPPVLFLATRLRIECVMSYTTGAPRAHDRKRAHVHHQVLITERAAALRDVHLPRCPLPRQSRMFFVSSGERNCPFFTPTAFPCAAAAMRSSGGGNAGI